MFEVPQSDIMAVELDKDVVQGKSTPRYIRSAFLSIMNSDCGALKQPERQILFELQSRGQRTIRGGLRLGHRRGKLASPSRRREQLNHIVAERCSSLRFLSSAITVTSERRLFPRKSSSGALTVDLLQSISISGDC